MVVPGVVVAGFVVFAGGGVVIPAVFVAGLCGVKWLHLELLCMSCMGFVVVYLELLWLACVG